MMLDSDLPPDSVLLTDAARRATELGDLTLAQRVARAAVAAGGGFEPRLILVSALGWAGRTAEAETERAALRALARTDAQRVQAAILEVLALAFTFRRPSEAEMVLDAAASTISDDAAALELAGALGSRHLPRADCPGRRDGRRGALSSALLPGRDALRRVGSRGGTRGAGPP